jgi:hypothetical protein
MAEHLIDYSRGQREDIGQPAESDMRQPPPPSTSNEFPSGSRSSTAEPSIQRMQHETSNADARERDQQKDSLGSQIIPSSEPVVTSGQICR